jgi:hypothetical protein
MSTRYEVAFGIKTSVSIPADIRGVVDGYFCNHSRKNDEIGEYIIYHADDLNYSIVLEISNWLLRDVNEDDCQFVAYSPENEHDVESFGNSWFDICLGLTF